MTKELKKAYSFLDLKYEATIEEIQTRRKILIKILRAKNIKKHKNHIEKIKKINACTELILDNIKKSGIPSENRLIIDSSRENVFTGLYGLILVSILALVSYIALL